MLARIWLHKMPFKTFRCDHCRKKANPTNSREVIFYRKDLNIKFSKKLHKRCIIDYLKSSNVATDKQCHVAIVPEDFYDQFINFAIGREINGKWGEYAK